VTASTNRLLDSGSLERLDETNVRENHAYALRLRSPGVSTPAPPVPPGPPGPPGTCPRGYRYVELEYGVDEFVVWLGDGGADADQALAGSPDPGVLVVDRGARDRLSVTRTFHPPDNFNLLTVSVVVHGPRSVTVVVDSAQDPHQHTVGPPTAVARGRAGGWRRGVVVSGVRRMNEVNARRARLVPGWVTVSGRVCRRGMRHAN